MKRLQLFGWYAVTALSCLLASCAALLLLALVAQCAQAWL